jgi:thiol-disulfide isomerase/thioredoxin
LVETKVPGDDSFFVLEFPKDQPLYDFDAHKIIGALEPLPTVKAGQPAPAWKVARWLDGKQHSLDEFRGKVIVLDFWGLWCGPCRSAVPALTALQEKYKDKPVVFVSIHTAEKDADALAPRIEKFAAEQNWKFLAAIDAGTMTNNSATCHAYGVHGYPTQIVIGGDGVVKFNSDEPPPGMEGIQGKTERELTADDRKKFEAYQKAYMEGAGETWPMDEHMSETEQAELLKRVNVFYMSRQIEQALGERK